MSYSKAEQHQRDMVPGEFRLLGEVVGPVPEYRNALARWLEHHGFAFRHALPYGAWSGAKRGAN